MSNLSQVVTNLQETSKQQETTISEIYEKILAELEKNLLTRLNEKLNTIENATTKRLQRLEQKQSENLTGHLMKFNETLKEIESKQEQIESGHKKALKSFRRGWWKPLVIGITLSVGIVAGSEGAILYFATEITALHQQRTGLQEQITRLQEDEKTLINLAIEKPLKICGQKRRLCAEIDQDAERYGTDGEFMVIKGH